MNFYKNTKGQGDLLAFVLNASYSVFLTSQKLQGSLKSDYI